MELNPGSMNEEVSTDIQRAINALPHAHQVEPQDGELVDNPRNRYIRLQDWAFTQRFTLVKESARPEQWILQSIHHHDKTRDSRKKEEKNRKRAWTSSTAAGCQFSMYICYRKKINGWAISYTHRKHNPEADKLRANRGAAKELQIRGKYEAKLAALNAEYSSPLPRPSSSSQLDTPLDHDMSQSQLEIPRSYTPIQMISSDSDSGQESHYFGNRDYSAEPEKPSQVFSPAPRQSGRSRKPTKKIESQQRREAEEESKPKRRKIRRSKVDVTSQLKELLGSDIDFST